MSIILLYFFCYFSQTLSSPSIFWSSSLFILFVSYDAWDWRKFWGSNQSKLNAFQNLLQQKCHLDDPLMSIIPFQVSQLLKNSTSGELVLISKVSSKIGLFEEAAAVAPVLPQYHPKHLMELMNFGKLRRARAILHHLVGIGVTSWLAGQGCICRG